MGPSSGVRLMRFFIILLGDALAIAALGYTAWVLYAQWKARRLAAMCPSCRDLDALKANDNVCPGCGQLHLKP